tara:strand:- start:254444 stop:255394 length:951 start_codon:yes stop_codon:yes gene_type:complete
LKNNLENTSSIAFYNLENLFDTANDPNTFDDDFTPDGRNRWNENRYQRKIKKLASVIAKIGVDTIGVPPLIVGVAEVENLKVLNDLVQSKDLEVHHYGIVHYDSLDERGIEVALLYQKEHFELIDSQAFPLLLYREDGERDFSRDILLVKGKLKGELTYFIVNHWPSRRKGTEETQPNRIKAAHLVHEIIATIRQETIDPKIVIMGDFNDNPTSPSIKQHLVSENFYNPFESMYDSGRGTATHEKNWYLFDQIIISRNFFIEDVNALTYKQAEIFEEHFLKSWKGKHKGSPFRTYIGKWHQGGVSDHFPVYITVEK